MDKVVLLLSVLSLGVSSQPITDSQRLFSIAVSRVQHLHLLAQRLFSDFESSLQTEEQRQLNKIFLQDFCNSDYIISPIDKHETQRSSFVEDVPSPSHICLTQPFTLALVVTATSIKARGNNNPRVLKLLSISYRLIESWEFPSRSLYGGTAQRYQISPKLSELMRGIQLLIKANQDEAEMFSDGVVPQLAPYGNYYQSLGDDESLRRSYELLACFKKDMHKVETYLTVAKCRLSPEANCTL